MTSFIPSEKIKGVDAIITFKKDNTSFNVVVGKSVGYGGTKRAYKITEDLVLLLPSRGVSIGSVHKSWDNVVELEVEASEFLTSVGLLNPKHERVIVVIPKHYIKINTYLSKSFEGFKQLGMYIVDLKYQTPLPNIFYDDNADFYDMYLWKYIFSELVYDIITLFKYRLDYSGDSTSLVAVKTDDINLVSSYKIRYFGFDFSHGILGVEQTWKKNDKYTLSLFLLYNKLIYKAIETVLFTEIGRQLGEEIYSLSKENYNLIETIVDFFNPILTELYVANSSDYDL